MTQSIFSRVGVLPKNKNMPDCNASSSSLISQQNEGGQRDSRGWSKAQSYVRVGEVKTLEGRVGREKERVWLNSDLSDWVSCSSRSVPTEKTEKSGRISLHFLASLTQLALGEIFTFLPGQTGQIIRSVGGFYLLIMTCHYTDACQQNTNEL